jgi:hypothetical protein
MMAKIVIHIRELVRLLYECNPQEELLNKIAEAAYRRAECWSSGNRVPLEVWLQAEKEIDTLANAIYS